MTIHLHMALNKIPPFKRQVRIKVPEDITVEELIELYAQKYKLASIFDRKTGISILVNGSRGSFAQKLKPNDRVKLFRPMIRG